MSTISAWYNRTNNLNTNVPAMLLTSGNVTATHGGVTMDTIVTKICTKCGENKQLDQFHIKKSGKNGRAAECKACFLIRARKWRLDHPEQSKGFSRKWKANNHEQVLESSRKYSKEHKEQKNATSIRWRIANIDKALETGKRWYKNHQEQARKKVQDYRAKNPQKIYEYQKLWRTRNPEKTIASNQNYRAIKKQVGGKISSHQWRELKEKYGFTCLCCGRKEPEIKLTLDHVIPLTMGGVNTIENAQPLCKSCNSRKHTRTTDYRK